MEFGPNTTKIVRKGDKAVVTNPDGGWSTLEELENGEGFIRFFAGMIRDMKNPAEQAAEIARSTKELKKDGDVYSGDLTEEGAKSLIRWRRGGDGPTISGAKGSVKFWTKDGVLSKYEYKLKGTIDFNGNQIDAERTTMVEIKDVGTTKVTPPDDAKKKLG
jgi:hypothetical protein